MKDKSKYKKPGRKPLYSTDEERKEAHKLSAKKHYEKNKDKIIEKQAIKHKEMLEIVRRYKEGKIVDVEN